LTQNVVR